MGRLLSILLFLFISGSLRASTQSEDSTEIFLLTCLPGRDVTTIYGHSAFRILNTSDGLDSVFSWGVYDFSAPDFAWKFAPSLLKASILYGSGLYFCLHPVSFYQLQYYLNQ